MEKIKEIIVFFSEYQPWAKVVMLVCLLIIIIILFLGRNASVAKNADAYSLVHIINETKDASELKAKLLLNKDIVPAYVDDKSHHDSVESIYNFEVDKNKFDLLLFFHSHNPSQFTNFVFLVDFYDVDVENVNWSKLNEKWDLVQTMKYTDLKAVLENTNGFNARLEYIGNGEVFQPGVVHLQLVGRRNRLKVSDLDRMIKNRLTASNGVYRITATYDYLISKFRPFMLSEQAP
jgi:hypothetical protein